MSSGLGLFILGQVVVQIGQELVGVHGVGVAGLFERLAAGEGAAQAVHADALENGHGLRRVLKDLGNRPNQP